VTSTRIYFIPDFLSCALHIFIFVGLVFLIQLIRQISCFVAFKTDIFSHSLDLKLQNVIPGRMNTPQQNDSIWKMLVFLRMICKGKETSLKKIALTKNKIKIKNKQT